ncbi:MAG: ABC transporter ATP-binding protein [Candidatus Thermoplasmatota archaeon]|nr:ABC transporter ATP-binding protein [Candidatus Thermoplasmatota archaeon]
MTENVVEVSGLVKHYPPDVKAVDGIDFSIPKGMIFSLLGPNGAGKTTAVEILEGLRSPTSGTARVFGVDVTKDYDQIRGRVGILPQNFEPFDMLRPAEAIEYWAKLYDMSVNRKDIDAIIDRVGLSNRKSSLSKKLSGGEKRKLGIALSIVNQPELLFLDEPTTGLDPKARRDLWKLIEEIREKGTTVLLTTHYLDEAEQLSDDVAIMLKGKIVARGTPSELIAKYGKMTVVVLAGAGKEGLYEVSRRGITATEEEGDVLVPVSSPAEMRVVLAKLASIELKVTDMYTRKQTLEDVFLNVVGTKMDEGVLAK